MVANFENGGAAINQLCRLAGAELRVVALDLDRPTADFTRGMALEVPDLVAVIPPEPVAAPANGEIAVGWLWVSTFIKMWTGSLV